MKFELVTITPTKAAEWLAQSGANRILKEPLIRTYAKAMSDGKWGETGDTLKFDAQGLLTDGQHRLKACIKSQTSFRSLVVWDATTSAAQDTGARRGLGDLLRISQEPDAYRLATITLSDWAWQHKKLQERVAASHIEALEWLKANPGLRDALPLARTLKRPPLRVPVGMAGAFIYRARLHDASEVDSFMEGVISGAGLKEHDPRLMLRNWLINRAAVSTGQRSPSPAYVCLAVMVKAWNYYMSGEALRTLRWRRGGDAPEEFPVLLGPEDTW